MADQLEQQLRDELRGVAASANPPADAWERFTRRVGSTPVRAAAPAPPTRLVLLDPETGDVIDGHRGEAASEFIVQADDTPSRSRGRLLLGAVAAMAALTAAGVVVASRDGGDDGSVSQQTDAVGTQADSGDDGESAVDAYRVVTGAYEAFNGGDLAEWGAEHASMTDLEDGFGSTQENVRALGERYEEVSCGYAGFGEYEFYDDEGPVGPLTGYRFDCTATYTSALTTASGVVLPSEFVWVIRNGRVVHLSSSVFGKAWQTLGGFEQSFLQWLSREHPDVLESREIEPDLFRIDASDDDLAAVLPYLDEFVAQSDRWPLEDS